MISLLDWHGAPIVGGIALPAVVTARKAKGRKAQEPVRPVERGDLRAHAQGVAGAPYAPRPAPDARRTFATARVLTRITEHTSRLLHRWKMLGENCPATGKVRHTLRMRSIGRARAAGASPERQCTRSRRAGSFDAASY
eukprot:scaffold5880_cov32-Tisochrysis_lutea.AAC.9